MYNLSLVHFLGKHHSGLGRDNHDKSFRDREIEANKALEQQNKLNAQNIANQQYGRDLEKRIKIERRQQKDAIRKEKMTAKLAKVLKNMARESKSMHKEELGKGFVAHTETSIKPKEADKKLVKRAAQQFDVKTLTSQLKRTASIVQKVSISAAKGEYNPLLKQAGSTIVEKTKVKALNLKEGLGGHPVAALMKSKGQKMIGQLKRGYDNLLEGRNRHVDDPHMA